MPPGPMTDMGDADDMNLHFHGFGSSPKKPGDDVLTTLAQPGQTLHYVVHVPANQEPGLYWYHPHVHGETSFQVGESGMSGAIVVEGLERHLPGLSKMKQRLIVVRATGIGDDAQPQHSNTLALHDQGPSARFRSTMRCVPTSPLRRAKSSSSDCSMRPGIRRCDSTSRAKSSSWSRSTVLRWIRIPERRRRRWNPRYRTAGLARRVRRYRARERPREVPDALL